MTLSDFEGKPVLKARIALKTPGSALDNTMDVSPQEWHTGDRVFLVLECRVGTVAFPEHEKGSSDEFDRLHNFHAKLATVVDETLVRDVLDRQRTLIHEAAGVHELEFPDPDLDADLDV